MNSLIFAAHLNYPCCNLRPMAEPAPLQDGVHVRLNGAPLYTQSLRDLRIRESVCDEPGNFPLARREVFWVLRHRATPPRLCGARFASTLTS